LNGAVEEPGSGRLSWEAREEGTAGLEEEEDWEWGWRREKGRGGGLEDGEADVGVDVPEEVTVDAEEGSAEEEDEAARAWEMNQVGSAVLPGGGLGAL
jgi:hypothetical protein